MFDNLRGTAACRGEAWAESVARRCRRDQPWPRTERAAAIARMKVEDLARDERLLEMLADELARWAELRWLIDRRKNETPPAWRGEQNVDSG
jgi:hypothetical protein